ncbi:hypothetical protein QBC37DRAFT_432690 [Rhypophila decipiens]|uniref:Uncharacterized protein n=1 Tax=Rhypophila decipiens TaxID=261697 RepID=A0AAN6Y237_9PEZI|nr:hypothetical protein QBC37DRAFT_432690 [Rhypophila decipiens]
MYSRYIQLDIGIPVAVPVNVSKTDANSDPGITVGGIVLQEYLRRLYRSLPASYHELDAFHHNVQLTKAEVFERMAKWCEPDMIRGIRNVPNLNHKHPKSKTIQLALAKRGDWDNATYGYGIERYIQWFGQTGKPEDARPAAIDLFYLGATPGVLEGGLIVRLKTSPSFPHLKAASARGFLPVLHYVHQVAWALVFLYVSAKIIFFGEL